MSSRRASKRRATPEWREFEQFVARIEAVLGPHGALISSPDRIRDRVTGKLREVDASLRYSDGTLVILECRQRSRIQDDTWIEQLAAKRDKVGATLAIAVSSKGFSSSATKTAAHYGIMLRRMANVTDDQLSAKWVRGWEAGFLKESVRPRALALFCEKATGESDTKVSLAPEVEKALRTDIDAPIAFRVIDDAPVTLRQLLERVKTDDVPADGQLYERDLRGESKPGTLYVKAVDGRRGLAQFHLVATIRKSKLPLDGVQYHEYSTPNGARAELFKGSAHLPGLAQPHELNIVLIPPDEPEIPKA